jgi:dihydrodipicolinate synthase/N-acetylneuraminate lyase
VVGIFAEETAGSDLRAQVGVIGLSTAQTRERIALAYRWGFRVFQISLPGWGALNDDEVLRFFHDVCDAFPDCRFLHYNVARSKRLLAPGDYRRLAGEIPNLAATKNTAPNVFLAAGLMREAPELQHFFGEATFPTGCLFGECSLLSSFGPVAPLRTREFFEAGCKGEWDRLARLHREYLSAMEDVLAPMRLGEWMDGAYDKVILRLGGFEMPLRLASPYRSFPEQVYEQCRAVLRDQYGEWAR